MIIQNIIRCTFMYVLVFIVCHGYSQWRYLGSPDKMLSDGLHPSVTSLYVTNCEVFAGTESGLYKSTDGCKTWTIAHAIDSTLKVVDIVRSTSVYFTGTNAGGIYSSDDGGIFWRRTNAFDSILCMAVNDSFILAGTTRGLQRCRIDDTVWTWVDTDTIPGGIISIAAQDSVVIAGGYQRGVYRSNNFGRNWKTVTSSGLPSSNVTSLAISGEIIFASVPLNGIYCIVNCGVNWAKIADSISAISGDIAVIGGSVFFTANDGVISTDFFGTTRHSVNAGLDNKVVITFFLSSGTLYAGSEHDGIWYSQVSELNVPVIRSADHQGLRKIDFKMQHGCNLNHNSVINFMIPEYMQVKVTLYDISGHTICTPVNGWFKEGMYHFPLNNEKIAHGFYIAKMNAGGSVVTTRFALH